MKNAVTCNVIVIAAYDAPENRAPCNPNFDGDRYFYYCDGSYGWTTNITQASVFKQRDNLMDALSYAERAYHNNEISQRPYVCKMWINVEIHEGFDREQGVLEIARNRLSQLEFDVLRAAILKGKS